MTRRLWKTFYLSSEDDIRNLQMVWQSACERFDYRMIFQRGFIETNVPLSLLRNLFRVAEVAWRDHVSDVKPLEEYTDEELDK